MATGEVLAGGTVTASKESPNLGITSPSKPPFISPRAGEQEREASKPGRATLHMSALTLLAVYLALC